MTSFDALRALALQAGLSGAWPFDPRGLRFLPEVRQMCAADKCGSYGKSWSCPPGCGSLEAAAAEAAAYDSGVLVQTVAQLEDEFDFEGMEAAAQQHRQAFMKFCRMVQDRLGACMPMGMGACTQCAECTYPDAPCRFPGRNFPSMEARGIQVSEACALAGAPYYYGPGTLAYTSCVLYTGTGCGDAGRMHKKDF